MNHTATVLEFGILVLSLVGIRRSSGNGESYLARLLKIQGIAYFFLVFSLQLSTIVRGPGRFETNSS